MSTPRPPRESSTVMLVRDGRQGLEVYMVRRHLNSDFVGGAYVFPGGSLDESDCDERLRPFYAGLSPEEAGRRLGIAPMRALGHYGAAIRETFEEAGVLLATRNDRLIEAHDEAEAAAWDAKRHLLLDKALGWAGFLAEEGLQLACDRVHYFAHWITPEGVPKRFTTRFFVAIAPAAQRPLCDAREVEAGEWVRPQEALDRCARGEFTMIFPTIKTLEELATFADTASLVAACAHREVTPTLPRVIARDGEGTIVLPGEPGYDEAAGQPPVAFDPSKRR